MKTSIDSSTHSVTEITTKHIMGVNYSGISNSHNEIVDRYLAGELARDLELKETTIKTTSITRLTR